MAARLVSLYEELLGGAALYSPALPPH